MPCGMSRFRCTLCVLVVGGWVACSSSGTSDGGGPSTPDAGPVFPTPRLGSGAAIDPVVQDPSRCGQPAHSWVMSEELATITARGDITHFTSDYLAGLAITAGMTLPQEPYYDAKAMTLTYKTQDRGVLVDASAMVAWPYGLPRDAPPAKVLLLLHGTQGFTDGCSLGHTEGAVLLVSYFASLGFVTVAPDYLGLKHSGTTGFPHPYLVGQATAIASLDAIRAAAHMDPADRDGVLMAPEVVFMGGSQGGHAALWVDRLAPYYAPELELLGGVATVPPADLLGEGKRALTSVVDATANLMAVLATSSPWYGAGNRLGEVFKAPWDTNIPNALAASCDPGNDIPSAPMNLSDVFQPLLLDAAANDTLASLMPFGCQLAENGLTTTSIARINTDASSYGILYIVGESDNLVHTPIERVAYSSLCQAGTPLQFMECAGASHTRTTVWSLPEIVAFVQARAQRQPFTADCTVHPPARCMATP